MTEFILVLATAAGLAAAPATLPAAPAATAPPPPSLSRAFRTYPDAASCEQAAAALTAPSGARLLCLPVESSSLVETAF
ncbi:hypothetical protein [Teichococcus wenyumeiae]|uniref:hypothetical protein n=1 Tax=Teichococcus wenyumeiae TaxID=2478470 RepID=UPI0011C47C3D|nr:hypothetical protein [Pseudoroseomonas wenyumeiae]